MDDADRAEALSELFLSAEIRRVRGARGSGPAFQADPGLPRFCAECGEEIPRERIEAVPDCTLCAACRRESEQRGAR